MFAINKNAKYCMCFILHRLYKVIDLICVYASTDTHKNSHAHMNLYFDHKTEREKICTAWKVLECYKKIGKNEVSAEWRLKCAKKLHGKIHSEHCCIFFMHKKPIGKCCFAYIAHRCHSAISTFSKSCITWTYVHEHSNTFLGVDWRKANAISKKSIGINRQLIFNVCTYSLILRLYFACM